MILKSLQFLGDFWGALPGGRPQGVRALLKRSVERIAEFPGLMGEPGVAAVG